MSLPCLVISRSAALITVMSSIAARASKARRTSAGVEALRSRAIPSMAFFAEPYSM